MPFTEERSFFPKKETFLGETGCKNCDLTVQRLIAWLLRRPSVASILALLIHNRYTDRNLKLLQTLDLFWVRCLKIKYFEPMGQHHSQAIRFFSEGGQQWLLQQIV